MDNPDPPIPLSQADITILRSFINRIPNMPAPSEMQQISHSIAAPASVTAPAVGKCPFMSMFS